LSRYLYRLGRACVRARRRTVVLWLVAVVALGAVGRVAGGEFHDTFAIPGSEAQRATDLLHDTFPAQAGTSATVVFHTTQGSVRDAAHATAISAALAQVADAPHVSAVDDPARTGRISQNGATALATVHYDGSALDLGKRAYDQLRADVEPARQAGLQTEFGGELPNFSEHNGPGGSEGIGILAAMLILLVAFGSVIAMGLPIGTALFGLAAGMTLIRCIAAFVDMPSTSEAIATMIGLGVGIDYALFIITRHRAGLHRGLTVEDAAGRAIATAGQAVIIAGGTVVIAILGLGVAGIPMVTFMGFGAAIVVAVTVVAAVTLMPALLGFAGHNIDRFGIPGTRRRVEHGTTDADGNYHGWARWSHHVARHPVAYLLASLGVLLLLAAPVLDLRLGQTDASQNPTSSTLRRSYDLLAHDFGPGYNGPLVVAVDLEGSTPAVLRTIETQLANDANVARVAPPVVAPSGGSAVVQVEPRTAPQDAATTELVHRLRDHALPDALTGTNVHAYVGGQTATFIDLSERVAHRLPWFIGSVIALSFVLLMVVFRSILVPLKAAVLNVLSIGAAYGVMVAVFQKGWGSSLFGVHEPLPIVSFIPMFMFAVLFGLSMDYEVFLLSRIREAYLESHDNTDSVVTGITTTARVITSAALIMISVFLSFVFGDEPTIKMAGLGLATAVFVDATIVRLVLVPSTMRLIGDANWWLPRWLDRRLPNLDIEGESKLPPEELEGERPQVPATEPTPELEPV
jgi:RND superfamily putative drug exporter